jgi:hypothetical protein
MYYLYPFDETREEKKCGDRMRTFRLNQNRVNGEVWWFYAEASSDSSLSLIRSWCLLLFRSLKLGPQPAPEYGNASMIIQTRLYQKAQDIQWHELAGFPLETKCKRIACCCPLSDSEALIFRHLPTKANSTRCFQKTEPPIWESVPVRSPSGQSPQMAVCTVGIIT